VPTHAGIVAELPAAIALLRAELAGAQGDPEKMAKYARKALARLADDESGPRFWARWLSGGGADWMRGRLADAEPVAAEMLAEGRATSDPYPLITSCYALAAVQQARGKLDAAIRTYRDGLRFANQGGRLSPFHAAEAHLGIAQVLYEQDHLDDALQHVTEGIELGRQLIWFFEPGRRLVTLAWIRQASGDPDGAMDAVNEAYRMHPSPEVNSRWNPAPVERARLLLVQGRIREVERWIEDRRLRAEDDISYMREPDHFLLARVLLARSDPERALGLQAGRLHHAGDRRLAQLDRARRRPCRTDWQAEAAARQEHHCHRQHHPRSVTATRQPARRAGADDLPDRGRPGPAPVRRLERSAATQPPGRPDLWHRRSLAYLHTSAAT
jgi:LuxR family maltose regulon positive regulatory protein